MAFDTKKLIVPMDFCRISSKDLEEDDFKKGEIVLVAGLQAMPINEEDPYTQRVYMLIHKVKAGIPTSPQLYMIDPVNLKKVGAAKQKQLTDNLQNYFDEEFEVVEEVVEDNVQGELVV